MEIENTSSSNIDGWEIRMNIPNDTVVTNSSNCTSKISNGILVLDDDGNTAFLSPGNKVQIYLEFTSSTSNYEVTFLQLNGIQMNLSGQTVTPTAIHIIDEEVSLFPDMTHSFAVTFEPYNGAGTIVWSCNNTSVATINSSTGVLTAVAPGNCVVTATCGNLTSTCDVIVKTNVVQTANMEITFMLAGNSWPASNGYKNVVYNIKAHNTSNQVITNWSCDVTLPAGSGLSQNWNCTITNTSGTTYHIVGSPYGIQPGATDTSIGIVFILQSTTYIPIPSNITP